MSGSPRAIAAVTLAVVGIVLAVFSLFLPWWTDSFTELAGSGSLNFLPGPSASISSGSSTVSETYSSLGLSQVGNVYEAVLIVGILVVALSAVAVVVGVFRSAHPRVSRAQWDNAFSDVSFGAAAVLLAMVVAAVLLQPPAISDAPHSDCGSVSGSSPCNSFWGAQSNSTESSSWGAATGWYLALVGGILLGTAALVWAPPILEPPPAPKLPGGVSPPAGLAMRPRFCPFCGAQSTPGGSFCTFCGARTPPVPEGFGPI